MTFTQKIYIAAAIAAILILGILGGSAWSNYKIGKLERAVENAMTEAAAKQAAADEKEKEAAGYKAKTEYLESNLSEIRSIARKQNEELENLNSNTNSARADVERARRVRTIAATAEELCERLAELGHPCE
jgi:hypothetical protein